MLTIEVHDRQTGTITAYLALSQDQTRARPVRLCTHASHFRGVTAAGVVRSRFQPLFADLLIVKDCICPAGLALAYELGEPAR